MFKLLQIISRWLASYTSVFVIAVAVVAFFVPDAFMWIKGNLPSVILGIIMLTMGLTLTADDFRILFSRPLDIFIGACAQFTIMPLLAFTLSHVFGLNPYLTAGIILVGCCPGGVSSNIMSFLCKGDVAFSVGMTTASTLLAPFVTPLLVLWLAGTQIDVNAWGMFSNILLVTILPVSIGFVCNMMFGKKPVYKDVQSVMPGLSVFCLGLIVGDVMSDVKPQLVDNGIQLFLLVMAVVFCHNTLGYGLGYGVGTLCGFSKPKKRTISIEVGMQNAGLATVLAKRFFASPEMLRPWQYFAYCLAPSAAYIILYRARCLPEFSCSLTSTLTERNQNNKKI